MKLLMCGMMVGLLGCSPANSHETMLDDAFQEAERGIRDGELAGGLRSTIANGFAELPAGPGRKRHLERFKEAVLVKGIGGADYNRLSKSAGRREILFGDCLAVAKRCGATLSERIEFRIAFIRWLCAEYARQQAVDSPGEGNVLGLHLTAEIYLFNLNRMIYRNLEEMEREFVGPAATECSPKEYARLRVRIEGFLGRQALSLGEIERRGREWRERGSRLNPVGRRGERPSWREYFQ